MDTELEENNGIGIFDTGERAWSYELKALFGIPINAPPDFQLILRRVHPEDRRVFYAIALEPFRPDCPARRTSQFRIVGTDGSVHWMRLVRLTIFRENAAHDAVRVLGFIVEISGPTKPRRPRQEAAIAA